MSDSQTPLQRDIWRSAIFKLVPLGMAAIFGVVLCNVHGRMRVGEFGEVALSLAGVALFLLSSVAFLQTLTHTITQLISAHPARHLNTGRAGALRFVMRAFGYVGIALLTLELVGIPVGNLVIGGAALGIVLGVAAQQALANFFAGIMLIITHPYAVGDTLTINSGSLGGKYHGTVKDIGLTHTRMKLEEGELVLLPNATILSSATLTFAGKPKRP